MPSTAGPFFPVMVSPPLKLRHGGIEICTGILLLLLLLWIGRPLSVAGAKSVLYRVAKKTEPACFIANILKTLRPNCVEVLRVLACLLTDYRRYFRSVFV